MTIHDRPAELTETAAKLEVFVNLESESGFAPFVGGSGPRKEEHPLFQEGFPWPESLMPQWSGMDTSRCAAAIIVETLLSDKGLDRFLSGADMRGETALILAELCLKHSRPDPLLRSLLGSEVAVILPNHVGQLSGRELPQGVHAQLAPDVEGVDKDLALRIRDTHDDADPWFAIEPKSLERLGMKSGGVQRPRGQLRALLVDDLGESIAAAWIPEGKDQRWYVFPCGSSWGSIVAWLTDQGVPEYVPRAAARVRSLGATDDAFLTRPEREAMEALRAFDRRAAEDRAEIHARLERTRSTAEQTREALLYGAGDKLKAVVAALLESCGFEIEDLDATFGSGKSGDLLVSMGGTHWMVEARAATGSPAEANVFDVVKHLRTWPNLGRSEAIEAGVLVLITIIGMLPQRGYRPLTDVRSLWIPSAP